MSAPYDEYVSKVITRVSTESYNRPPNWDQLLEFSPLELRSLLSDAWLAGLAYSLNLIEGEKERRG